MDNNSGVDSRVGRFLLQMNTPELQQLILKNRVPVCDEHLLCKGHHQQQQQQMACSRRCDWRLVFFFFKQGFWLQCLSVFLHMPLNGKSLGSPKSRSLSQVATEETIWTTSPFSPWMVSFTSISACRAGASSATWDGQKREGENMSEISYMILYKILYSHGKS